MRGLEKQKQAVWFVEQNIDDSSYNPVAVYSLPIRKMVSVSATANTPDENLAGVAPSYDRYITCYDREFHPKEGTLLYVDTEPKLTDEGKLEVDENGNPAVECDYVLARVMDTQKGSVSRFGIKRKDNEDN